MYNIQLTKSEHKNGDIINMKTPHPLSTPDVHYYFFTVVQLDKSRSVPLYVIDMRLFFHVICFNKVFMKYFHEYI